MSKVVAASVLLGSARGRDGAPAGGTPPGGTPAGTHDWCRIVGAARGRARDLDVDSAAGPASSPSVVMWLRARRTALTCAGLLFLIAGLAVLLCWLSWRTLVDHRLALTGGRAAEVRAPSLETDLRVGDEPAELARSARAARVDRRGDGAAAPERSDEPRVVRGSSGVGLPGPVLAGGAATAVLGASVAAAWLVLRRCSGRPGAPPDGPEGPVDVDGWQVVAMTDEPAEPSSTTRAVHDDLADHLSDRAGRADRGAESSAGSGGTGPAVSSAGGESASDERGLGVPLVTADRAMPVGERLWTGSAGAPAFAEALVLEPVDAPVRERLFDRRASRRVPYGSRATLLWAGQGATVRTEDISETGTRCVMEADDRRQLPEPPRLDDDVRIMIPLRGELKTLAVKVQWRERTGRGVVLGLHFVALPDDARASLRTICAEHS